MNQTIPFFQMPLEVRCNIYKYIVGEIGTKSLCWVYNQSCLDIDCSKYRIANSDYLLHMLICVRTVFYRLVSKQFWEELCSESQKGLNLMDMKRFIADFLRGRLVLLESETMLIPESLAPYYPPISIDYARNVRHLHLTNFCLVADAAFRQLRPGIPCCDPSSGHGITHLRYAFRHLRTVSCSCTRADVEWSDYETNDSCINLKRFNTTLVGLAVNIPPKVTGVLPLLHGFREMAVKSRVLLNKGLKSRSKAYRKASRRRRDLLLELAGELGSINRHLFEESLQTELTNALLHAPPGFDILDESSSTGAMGSGDYRSRAVSCPSKICEKRWPTAKCIIRILDSIRDEQLGVPFLQNRVRSFYELRKIDEWKWVFCPEKIPKPRRKDRFASRT